MTNEITEMWPVCVRLTIRIKYDANKRKINNNKNNNNKKNCCCFSFATHLLKWKMKKRAASDVKVIDTQKRHIK